MQRRQRSGSAQNLIGLIVERDGLSISPNAPQFERLDVTAPKSKKIKLRLASGKIDRNRFGRGTAFPTDARHTDVGPMEEYEAVPRRRFPKEMKSFASTQPRIAGANVFATGRVQLVPDIARQSYLRLRRIFPHRKKWRRLSLIARFDFRRHDLCDRDSKNSGDRDGGGGTLQGSRNYCGHRAQAGTQLFKTDMGAGTGARTQRQCANL